MFNYPVNLTEDGDTILVTFDDVPEAITFGVDRDEAMLHAVDALASALSFYVNDRKPLPNPSKAKRGQSTVCPDALECVKLGIYKAMNEQGVRKSDLARLLGWHMPQIDRIFDLRHASRLDQLETVGRALGKQITVNVV